jgi:hypothetical protein
MLIFVNFPAPGSIPHSQYGSGFRRVKSMRIRIRINNTGGSVLFPSILIARSRSYGSAIPLSCLGDTKFFVPSYRCQDIRTLETLLRAEGQILHGVCIQLSGMKASLFCFYYIQIKVFVVWYRYLQISYTFTHCY